MKKPSAYETITSSSNYRNSLTQKKSIKTAVYFDFFVKLRKCFKIDARILKRNSIETAAYFDSFVKLCKCFKIDV